MFDLVTERSERPLRDSRRGTAVVSVVAHVLLLAALLAGPLLYTTAHLPKVTHIAAFIVAATPPPPPPPPPAPGARAAEPRPEAMPAESASPDSAPVEAPSGVRPEPAVPPGLDGVEGGVEGGVPGGVVGGVVGGLMTAPPPPPPPPAAPAGPVRVGGQITVPALVRRVEPSYPPVAVAARVTGTVVLELVVSADGLVQDVTVLRSQGVLDRAAMAAVREWLYSPLVLNGIPTPFIVTVTMNFSLRAGKTPQVAG
jgi:periplasmic protein TonB